MSSPRIAFFDTKPYDRQFFDETNATLGFEFDISYFETRLNVNSAPMAAGFDTVCAFVNDDLGSAAVGRLADMGVRLIALRCAGFNNVDLKSALDRLTVVRVPGYSPYAVAEYALAMLLTLNRNLHRAFNRVRESNFSINGFLGFDMRGKTFGIVGTGRIGQVLAELLAGFGMRILAYDPYPDEQAAKRLNFEYVELDELYRRSDMISLHCPLTHENLHLIDRRAIELMKPGCFLVNTSRGKLIDTPALIEGLKNRKLGGAALDVYEEEDDYFFEDFSASGVDDDVLARLMTFPNVLITSHQAFFTREAMANIARTTLQNIRDFYEGGELKNAVCYRCSQ
ncbi:MAG: 2-hydroxyacid dehydrogenase [Victivallaceae bacterium]|nr:2-hydroxyacid dehydrogenase [Victivallaceae bacterium]